MQQFPILLSTMNDLPGYRVARVYGEVFGLTVRSRNAFSNLGASLKSLAGGELSGLTKLLFDSRNQALGRLSQEAQVRGANAVLALRFDCNEIGGVASEIAAYGTAVFVVPETDSSAPSTGQQQAAQPSTGQQQAAPQNFGQQQGQQYQQPQGFGQ